MMQMKSLLSIAVAVGLFVVGCNAPDPKVNTPTSGKLVLYVDELYAPLFSALADSFTVRNPNAKVEVRALPARMAVQELINAQQTRADTDTSATAVAILGRQLLADERAIIDKAEMELREYKIARDGLAVVVPNSSPLQETTLDRLQRALRTNPVTLDSLDAAGGSEPLRFILPDQNSSTFMVLRATVLGDSNITAPVRYYSTIDSVRNAAAAGEGVAISGWYAAHRDSARLRVLRIGYTSSNGIYTAPIGVSPVSLVTKAYPISQPVIGYTLSLTNSLSTGFLAWVSLTGDAQRFITHQGLQGENIKYQITIPE